MSLCFGGEKSGSGRSISIAIFHLSHHYRPLRRVLNMELRDAHTTDDIPSSGVWVHFLKKKGSSRPCFRKDKSPESERHFLSNRCAPAKLQRTRPPPSPFLLEYLSSFPLFFFAFFFFFHSLSTHQFPSILTPPFFF